MERPWTLQSSAKPSAPNPPLISAAGAGPPAIALTSARSVGVISPYELGILPHLHEPPIPGLDADRIDASDEAYERLDMPDGVLGLGSYAATLALAAAGGDDRHRTRPWLPMALAAKATLDAAQAARLTRDHWVRHRAFCSWCLGAAAATFVALPLALPEARAALHSLLWKT